MKDFKKTKIKLSFLYTTIFTIIFLIIGVSFFSLKYFDKDNIDVEITEVLDFEPTGYGGDVDDIFKILEEASPQKTFVGKQYGREEYKKDIYYFLIFIFFTAVVFYTVSFKLINKTISPLEDSMSDMKDFIDNAGHELKTPLAVLDSSLWVMKEKKEFDHDLLKKSQKEILRTNKLIETLRDLSNITSISKKSNFQVGDTVKEIISKYEADINKKLINIIFNILEDFNLEVNKNYFEILFSNIISNAIKYNKNGGSIIITLINKTIVVEDSGLGIPSEKIKKIFNRFYRVQKHRNKEGFGLGLAIVSKILKIYKWKINIESEEGVGTKMIIKF